VVIESDNDVRNGGIQDSVKAGPDTVDEIRRQVEDRVAQEDDQAPAGSGGGDGGSEISSKLIGECLFANELGDGTLFAAQFRNRFLYVKNTQEWFEWSGAYWERDVMGRALAAVEQIVQLYLDEYNKIAFEITEQVKRGDSDTTTGQAEIKKRERKQSQILKRASQLRGDKRRTACLKFAHTIEDPLAITGDDFDQRPMLLACSNGVIDLATGKLRPGKPSEYLSLASPIEWQKIAAPTPLWEKTLHEIFNKDDELIAYMQRLFGYGITGLVTEKVFPVLWGKDGWNGRSTIVDTIGHVLGPLAGVIPAEMLLSSKYAKGSAGPSPDIMTLRGLRMAFASETDEGHRFSAAKVKWLTGKDELVGRSPHDKYLTRFTPSHKLFLMTNSQPSAPANDRSFWERLHLVPFLISFVNREPQEPHERRAILNLDEQLRKESSGILAWLVRGCLLWQKHGLLPPRSVTEATEQYRRNEDLLADFIDECCLREPGIKEKSAVLYARFIEWYHANVGKKEPSGTWFGKTLSQKYEKTKSEGCVVYHGIGLISDQGGFEGY